jgi:hypothetical protein
MNLTLQLLDFYDEWNLGNVSDCGCCPLLRKFLVYCCRKKIANEHRIQEKKFKSDKKSSRRANIDY